MLHKCRWDYSYEAANGIKQEATGTLRLIDDSRVSVMRGSYEFVGADGIVYAVEWFADETGFHATAPHLPQNVVPNHPEVAAAVEAQLRFAAEQGWKFMSCSHCQELCQQASWLVIGCARVNNQSSARLAS